MGNEFVNDDFKVVGKVQTIVRDCKGKLRHEAVNYNTVQADLKNRLCAAIKLGTFAAISDYATTDGSVFTKWTAKDGIMVFNSAFTTKDGTLLRCYSTAGAGINSLVIQGTNSLFDDGEMSMFVLGTSVNTDTAFDSNYFVHAPAAFDYSDGDTITVNWTISVT